MSSIKRTTFPSFLVGRKRQPQHPPSIIPQQAVPSALQLSQWSTGAVPNSAWCSNDFMLGTGMVVIQEKTEKILLVYETKEKYWFFPRGRKDIGETLEQAALREAYEEVCSSTLHDYVFSS